MEWRWAVSERRWECDGVNGAAGLDGSVLERRRVRLGSAFWLGMLGGVGKFAFPDIGTGTGSQRQSVELRFFDCRWAVFYCH